MAFFGGLSGWSGSSWSPWSGLGSDSDSESDSDTVTTTTPVVQTSTSTPSPTPATATVVQQVTTTAVSIVTSSTPASTLKAVTVTQTSKPASSAMPSTTAQNNAQTSQQPQQQQQSQVSQVGSSSIAVAQSSSSTSRPSSSSTPSPSPSSSTNSTEDVGDIPDDWTYFGCVPNNNGMPALNTTYATSDELTPVLCISACAASQYHYAGLQNGNACFCGSTITTPSISSSSSSSSSCNMNCTGDPSGSSKCGGPSSMSFYHLKSIDPNSSSTQDSSSTSADLDGQYGNGGSETVVVSLPDFTGTLMEYGDPRFRSGKDGVVFGEMFKVSSSSSRYSPDRTTKLEGLALVILLGWVGLRILR